MIQHLTVILFRQLLKMYVPSTSACSTSAVFILMCYIRCIFYLLTAACQVMGVIDLLFFRNGRIPEEEEDFLQIPLEEMALYVVATVNNKEHIIFI